MNEEQKESLNAIRFKIVNDQTDFNKQEVLHLTVVYSYITKYAGKERVLNMSCQSCLITAMNITKNYIKYHEDIDVQLTNIVRVEKRPTLKELREQHPNIKSNSVEGFLKKLEDGRRTV